MKSKYLSLTLEGLHGQPHEALLLSERRSIKGFAHFFPKNERSQSVLWKRDAGSHFCHSDRGQTDANRRDGQASLHGRPRRYQERIGEGVDETDTLHAEAILAGSRWDKREFSQRASDGTAHDCAGCIQEHHGGTARRQLSDGIADRSSHWLRINPGREGRG
ncbi:MAG: hypothetical protein ABR543_15295 [Gemmatimonadaceae bacterium]